MVIQIVPFDKIISSNDWEETKSDTEIILVAKPSKDLGVAFFQYSDGDRDSPVFKFKPNSRIRVSGGELIFDTDDIVEK